MTPAPGGLGWHGGALHDAARLVGPTVAASCVPAHETPVQTDMYKSSRSALMVNFDMVSFQIISRVVLILCLLYTFDGFLVQR